MSGSDGVEGRGLTGVEVGSVGSLGLGDGAATWTSLVGRGGSSWECAAEMGAPPLCNNTLGPHGLCNLGPFLPDSRPAMSSGFPQGYFLIKSVAADRVLDVENAADIDGTPVIAWPELEANWVQGLFLCAFVLCSQASLHLCRLQRPLS